MCNLVNFPVWIEKPFYLNDVKIMGLMPREYASKNAHDQNCVQLCLVVHVIMEKGGLKLY